MRAGGRLGVAALDLGCGATLVNRPDERFPMCSTFKFLAASAVLAKVDRGLERLDRHIAYSRTDLVEHSPVTLCEAAMTQSDNGAANLILRSLHGPGGVTRYARSVGDAKTRLDRMEPELNDSVPGDARDTTTPRSMATNLRRIVLGSALSPAAQGRLQTWMLAAQTGLTLLRWAARSTRTATTTRATTSRSYGRCRAFKRARTGVSGRKVTSGSTCGIFASTGSSVKCCAIVASARIPSVQANASPMQRRLPPPNGKYANLGSVGRIAAQRSGRKTSGSSKYVGLRCDA